MVLQKILHPALGFTLFVLGMILGTTVHVTFAVCAIIGGLMLGFSTIINSLPTMTKQAKRLFYGTFVCYALLFSLAFFIVLNFIN